MALSIFENISLEKLHKIQRTHVLNIRGIVEGIRSLILKTFFWWSLNIYKIPYKNWKLYIVIEYFVFDTEHYNTAYHSRPRK